MAEKEKQDIEDAEIVVSDGTTLNDDTSNSRKFQFVLIYGLIFLFSASIFGLVVYSDRKLFEDISDLETKMKSSPPVVSIETLDTRFNDFEVLTRSIIANSIAKEVVDIEKNFTEKIDVLSDVENTNESIGSLKEDLLQLKFKLEKDISDMIISSGENVETQNIQVISELEFKKRINFLKENFDIKVSRLTNRLNKIEKDLAVANTRFVDFNSSFVTKNNRNFISNVNSLKELEKNFAKIAYEVLKTEADKDIGGAPWSILFAKLKSIFIFRSTSPKEGFTTDAILSRAEDELLKGNFESCLRELNNLDDSSAELFFDWKTNLKNFINKTD
mgnify:CR=1 FL=1